MKTYKIQVLGMVQGIGFRPFVAELAERLGVTGNVRNDGGIVTITCQVEKQEELDRFIELLRFDAPKAAYIQDILVEPAGETNEYRTFEILESEAEVTGLPMLPPDLGMCPACRAELLDPSNKRYRYPYISCALCGPRYSILKSMPYDRDTTTMDTFKMCPECEAEYTRPGDRRRHAQTISCHHCGPQLRFLDLKTKTETEKEQALQACIQALKAGEILALKGVGGFQLCCLPTHADTVARLREVKGREEKPFAIMYSALEQIKEHALVSEAEERWLTSLAAPIVLLEQREDCDTGFAENVLQGSQHIGAFLPYTGLHQLLCDVCGPLVMTSANRSGNPILYRDEDMEAFARAYPDIYGIATQSREILAPLDDSVLRVENDHTVFIRRSRGYAPLSLRIKSGIETGNAPAGAENIDPSCIICYGGDLKSVAAIATKDTITATQYFGDLEDAGVSEGFAAGLNRLETLLGVKPTAIACDLHPGYISADLAKKRAAKLGLPVYLCQHHKAHIGSVMAEHGLIQCIGVALDGTGYGLDGMIWGGEFFVTGDAGMERMGHLSYVHQVGGDTVAKESRLMALCHVLEMESRFGEEIYQIPKVKALAAELVQEADLYRGAIRGGVQVVQSSSTGRLFDSVCAFLGLGQRNHYEGYCATRLEKAASHAYHMLYKVKTGDFEAKMQEDLQNIKFLLKPEETQENSHGKKYCLDQEAFLKAYLMLPYDTEYMALLFHFALADGIVDMCHQISLDTGITQVALSGGVWANMLLWRRAKAGLEALGYEVFTNENYPTGDGGIAIGQAYLCMHGMAEDR